MYKTDPGCLQAKQLITKETCFGHVSALDKPSLELGLEICAFDALHESCATQITPQQKYTFRLQLEELKIKEAL